MLCPVTGTKCESSGCSVYIDGRCARLQNPPPERAHRQGSVDHGSALPDAHEIRTPAPARGTTPRTDAEQRELFVLFDTVSGENHYVSAEFARQLERELSSANEQIAALREALKPFANYACEPPCECHNCKARAALAATRKEEGNDACVHGVSLRGYCNECDASEVG